MTMSLVRRLFEAFAHSVNAPVLYRGGTALAYVDLESAHVEQGYVRVCIDPDDGVVIVEAGFPLPSLFAAEGDAMQRFLDLGIMTSPCRTGKRFFPMFDMKNQYLVLSYVVGNEVIRDEGSFGNLAETCVREMALMMNEVREALAKGKAKATAGNKNAYQQALYRRL
jgi:hypothetical protein